jgi:Peptidase inhibitor family I36
MRKILFLAARMLTGLVVVAAIVAPAPATAAPASPDALSDCPNNSLCLWEHVQWGGTLGAYNKKPDGQCYSMGVMNNQTSSLYNRTSTHLYAYDSGDCTGKFLDFGPFGASADLTYQYIFWPVTTWNDKISSFKWVS